MKKYLKIYLNLLLDGYRPNNIRKQWKNSNSKNKPVEVKSNYSPKVTMGFDFLPTLQLEGGYVLPRRAEMIINSKYYPNGKIGEWLCDPNTGEKLPIAK